MKLFYILIDKNLSELYSIYNRSISQLVVCLGVNTSKIALYKEKYKTLLMGNLKSKTYKLENKKSDDSFEKNGDIKNKGYDIGPILLSPVNIRIPPKPPGKYINSPSHEISDIIDCIEFSFVGNGIKFYIHRSIVWTDADLHWYFALDDDFDCDEWKYTTSGWIWKPPEKMPTGWYGYCKTLKKSIPETMSIRVISNDKLLADGDVANLLTRSSYLNKKRYLQLQSLI